MKMLIKKKSRLVLLTVVLSIASYLSVPLLALEGSDQAINYLKESWRWSKYWFGSTGVDDIYLEGRGVHPLVFWSKAGKRVKTGLCSIELKACIAGSGPYLGETTDRMALSDVMGLEQAFEVFVKTSFGGSESYFSMSDQLTLGDFNTELRQIVLPILTPPSSVELGSVPENARLEAEHIARLFRCEEKGPKSNRTDCSGRLTFSSVGPRDPYWFVLRSCSSSCKVPGNSIEEATRSDSGWEVTSRGFVATPKEAVERLRRQIENAKVFSLPE